MRTELAHLRAASHLVQRDYRRAESAICAYWLAPSSAMHPARRCSGAAGLRPAPKSAAAVMFNTLVRFIREALRTLLVVGQVVAVGAFFTEPSVTAVRIRPGLTRAG